MSLKRLVLKQIAVSFEDNYYAIQRLERKECTQQQS